jgi:hypothetical protein
MPTEPERTLREIKDVAVLLSMAGEYLCEEVFLEKLGSEVEKKVEVMAHQIQAFKQQFVGILVQELSLQEELQEVSRFGALLKRPETALNGDCAKGVLGEKLWEKTRDLTQALEALKTKIEGRPISYEKGDVILNLKGRLKFIFQKIAGTYPFFFKLAFLAVGVFVVTFCSLYFTMESEKDLLKKIHENETFIASKTPALSRLDEQIVQMKERAERIREADELTRQEKIEAMYLNIKSHELVQERERLQLELSTRQKKLDENMKRIEEIKQKPLLAKLLKL